MENEKKGNTIFLSVIGIATLLVAIIGATFAWFSATITGNETASSVTVTTATLGIEYLNGNEIKMEKVSPGATSGEKTFTVASVGASIPQAYEINWRIYNFDFVDKSDLIYSLSGTATSGGGTVAEPKTNVAMPTSFDPQEGALTKIGEGTLPIGAVHTYTLSVTFKETGSDQNSNQGKTFLGKIWVSSPNVSASGS